MGDELTIKYVPLATVRRWDRNHKRHDLGALCESIARHGFRDPPAYDAALNGGEGGIVEGNGRADALSAMKAHGGPRGLGWPEGRPAPLGIMVALDADDPQRDDWLMPVLFGLDAPSQAAAEAYAVAHNNLTMAGGDFTDLDMARMWEADGYAALLADLAAQGETPITIDETALDALLTALAGEGAIEPGGGGDDFDTTPDETGPTRCQPGDLWIIGGVHRLIIGDSTDPATVARLMQGERAAAVVTDPPYAIYGSSTGIGGDVVDDNMVRPFMRLVLQIFCQFTDLGAHIYAFCDWRSYSSWWQETKDKPLIVRNCIVWDKGDGGLGSMYTMRHEFMIFFERIEKAVTMTKANKARSARTVHGVANVQRFNVPQHEDRLHNAAKPVGLIQVPIEASSDPDDLILDLFLGSGTTLIAAHRTGRRCYGCEISPTYGDVILRRCEAEGLTVEREAS